MTDRLDYTFKKFLGREYTSSLKQWYEEKPGLVLFIHRTSVWMDDIPALPPGMTTAVVRYYNTLLLTKETSVTDYRAWKAEDPPGVRLYGFIPPKFHQNYTVKVFDNTDREIPATDGSNWLFDYDNGTLTFDTNPANFGWFASTIKIRAYLYIGSVMGGYSLWKNAVPTPADLPLVGNVVGDVRPVADYGNGHWALFRCTATVGDLSAQWQVLEGEPNHLDCGIF
jgi:hypothetical protein